MDRLISTEDLLQRLNKEREYLLERGLTGAEHILVHNFMNIIDEVPTVTATYIRATGECIPTRRGASYYIYHCSSCNFTMPRKYKFCPECGAYLQKISDSDQHKEDHK